MRKDFKLNIKKSPVDERDYLAETIYVDSADLPEEYDLRNDLHPVRDQGSQGSCAGMTAACIKEWQEKIDYGFDEYMSPQFVYNSRKNQETEGMHSRDVMKILHKIGSVSESDYPYNTFTPITGELKEKAYKHHIEGYAAIHSIEDAKKALIKNGPLYIAFPVYNYGPRLWKPRQGDVSLGGHAVVVVGYNKEGFILRNSWGKDWNYNGHTIFPFEDFGLHWEIWGTLDADSGSPIEPVNPKPKPVVRKRFIQRVIEWFLGLFGK